MDVRGHMLFFDEMRKLLFVAKVNVGDRFAHYGKFRCFSCTLEERVTKYKCAKIFHRSDAPNRKQSKFRPHRRILPPPGKKLHIDAMPYDGALLARKPEAFFRGGKNPINILFRETQFGINFFVYIPESNSLVKKLPQETPQYRVLRIHVNKYALIRVPQGKRVS